MSNASKLRDWLVTQDGPRTAAQLRAGTGMNRHQVNAAIHDMVIAGILTRDGSPYLYALGREPASRQAGTPEETRERARARQRAWRHKTGRSLSMDEHLAQRRAKAAERKREQEASKVERKRHADARLTTQAKREQSAAKRLQPALAALAKSAERRSAPKPEAKPKPSKVETVEEWMARTGKEPARLQMGAVSESNRLRHVDGGHRALNRESWARRVSA